MVALDVMAKAAAIRVLQAEINDFLGTIIKIEGEVDDVRTAIDAGFKVAEQMQGKPASQVIPRLDGEAWKAIASAEEYNPLIQQKTVTFPDETDSKENTMTDALGFIETQGFTAVFDAIDRACKAANVEVIGKEKLGGGYITVVVRGDVAAVKAAIDAGRSDVEKFGNLIAAHVIARPSAAVLGLLPG